MGPNQKAVEDSVPLARHELWGGARGIVGPGWGGEPPRVSSRSGDPPSSGPQDRPIGHPMVERAPSDQRAEPRKKKTLFCQLEFRGRRIPAVVLDLSPSGLFVRTATALPLGTEVEVTLRLAGGKAWNLRAEIARHAESGTSRDPLRGLGLGLRITSAPEGFAGFVESLQTGRRFLK